MKLWQTKIKHYVMYFDSETHGIHFSRNSIKFVAKACNVIYFDIHTHSTVRPVVGAVINALD
jgi:hypothetical protein